MQCDACRSVQAILTEYFHSEMAFHAKALELYTVAFHHVTAISDDEAVEVSGERERESNFTPSIGQLSVYIPPPLSVPPCASLS